MPAPRLAKCMSVVPKRVDDRRGLRRIGRGDVKRGEIYKDTHVDTELFTSTTGIGRSR